MAARRRDSTAPRRCLALLAAVLSLAAWPTAGMSRTPRGEQVHVLKVSGIVTEITANRITLQPTKGDAVTVTASRDYTDEVAFGSHVTVNYVVRGPVNVLQSLTPPLETLFVPVYEIRQEIHSVIVLPRSRVEGSNAFFTAMESYLRSQRRWDVKPRVLAEEAWRYASRSQSTLNLINPTTGAVDISRYSASRGHLMRQIAATTRVDAVLDARLVIHPALLHARRRLAVWDGAREFAGDRQGLDFGRLALFPIRAQIPATTLEVKLWDVQGKPLWSRRRGFAVLYVEEGLLDKLRPRPLAEALENKAEVDQWFSSFFRPLFASPEPASRHAPRR